MNKERVIAAAKWMKKIHEDGAKFDLSEWRQLGYKELGVEDSDDADYEDLHNCGTVCCFAGWLAVSPEFIEAGGRVKNDLPFFNDKRVEFAIAEYLEIPVQVAELFIYYVNDDNPAYSRFGNNIRAIDVHDALMDFVANPDKYLLFAGRK